jgi:putative protease
MNKPELLSPAGDLQKMKTAIHYGADAVYLGASRFSLRNRAGNFGPEELAEAVQYAHDRGVKVFVTVNTFARREDLPLIKEHIGELNEIRPDAVIVSDPGVFSMFREKAPALDLHVSTQANVTNVEAARFWERMGAARIILARELSIDEIANIGRGVGIELEAFVHGAVCLSYSGKCYLSSFMASRGANTGECANSCRWKYALMEEKRPGLYFPVFEDDRGAYVMNSRDLCLVEYLPLLAGAGVSSFKIEGRMKGIHYVAGVTRVYREAVDLMGDTARYRSMFDAWRGELAYFGSRGYNTGMLFGPNAEPCNVSGSAEAPEADVAAEVIGVGDGRARLRLRTKLSVGDAVEYMTPGLPLNRITLDWLRYEDGLDTVSARPDEIVLTSAPQCVGKGDLLRKIKV